MCLHCAAAKLRGAPTLSKSQILNPKLAGLGANDKPWVIVVGHSTDAVDGATRVESAREHAEQCGYRVIKWPKPPKIGRPTEAFSGNAKGATLVVRVECHGAPGWTLGSDGRFESECSPHTISSGSSVARSRRSGVPSTASSLEAATRRSNTPAGAAQAS